MGRTRVLGGRAWKKSEVRHDLRLVLTGFTWVGATAKLAASAAKLRLGYDRGAGGLCVRPQPCEG